ncbi:MAG TPA: NUDIX domain-containing protein [Polyangia bacterium]
MAAGISAGLLMYHQEAGALSVLLAHPGGPFFRNKDDGAWSIPKGLADEGEDLVRAACREFTEETGLVAPAEADLIPLGEVTQKSGKHVHAWAFAGTLPSGFVLTSSVFSMVWPPRSGKTQSFPEVDRVEMFPLAIAVAKILPAQRPFLDRLQAVLAGR